MFGTVALQFKMKTTWRESKKVACKLILMEKYKSYEQAMKYLDLDTLKQRRIDLNLTFARKCLKSKKMKNLFPPNDGYHNMKTRNHEHFHVTHANTKRLQESPIIYMQDQLNNEIQRKKNLTTFGTFDSFILLSVNPCGYLDHCTHLSLKYSSLSLSLSLSAPILQ